uniref:Uncharacterized protein n=1 Tax=Timema douglasi TaxID=61478 RepID=A0A7R8VJW1_TIMDO|nr:unnamed protein product [Timema douglasi]
MTDAAKRTLTQEMGDSSDEYIGPMPSEASKPKKRKILKHEQLYLANLPCAESYERSYMHRDVITHIVVTKDRLLLFSPLCAPEFTPLLENVLGNKLLYVKTDFIITGSCDGHIKFWKKMEELIEFVKHFRSHLGPILDLSANSNGSLLCSISSDKSLKVFDVVNFDMINMMRLDYVPHCAEWIHSPGDAISALALSDADSNKVYVYDGQGTNVPIHVFERLHTKPVVIIKTRNPPRLREEPDSQPQGK